MHSGVDLALWGAPPFSECVRDARIPCMTSGDAALLHAGSRSSISRNLNLYLAANDLMALHVRLVVVGGEGDSYRATARSEIRQMIDRRIEPGHLLAIHVEMRVPLARHVQAIGASGGKREVLHIQAHKVTAVLWFHVKRDARC